MKESKRKSKVIEIIALLLSVLAFIIGIFAFGISSNIKDKTEVKPEGITGGVQKNHLLFSPLIKIRKIQLFLERQLMELLQVVQRLLLRRMKL